MRFIVLRAEERKSLGFGLQRLAFGVWFGAGWCLGLGGLRFLGPGHCRCFRELVAYLNPKEEYQARILSIIPMWEPHGPLQIHLCPWGPYGWLSKLWSLFGYPKY